MKNKFIIFYQDKKNRIKEISEKKSWTTVMKPVSFYTSFFSLELMKSLGSSYEQPLRHIVICGGSYSD